MNSLVDPLAIASIGISFLAVVFGANAVRIRHTKRPPVVVVVAKAKNTTKKEHTKSPKQQHHPIVIIPGTAQSSAVWLYRMQLLADRGYDCHCLNLTQDGNWTSSYKKQIPIMRDYIATLDGRPILIGHSQGGTKVQNYMLARDGNDTLAPKNRASGIILLGSALVDISKSAGPCIEKMMSTPKSLLCLFVCLLGGFEGACFFGGGILRYQLQTFLALFNEETTTTTLLGKDPVGLKEFANQLDGHDPGLTDNGIVEHVHTPAEVLEKTGCQVLVLSGTNDRIIPDSMVEENAKMWHTTPVWVKQQGHQLGDASWERTVMEPIYDFLETLEK